MQIIVDSLMTSYFRVGDGPQLLILHGWGDRADNWKSFAKRLSKDFEVIVPDLPGFGGTQAPPAAWTLNDYSKFVAKFVAKLGLKPEVIIGHSNGGGIAIRGLAIQDLSSKQLVLLASAGVRTTNGSRKRALKATAKVGKIIAKPLPTKIQRRLRNKLYAASGSDMLLLPHMEATFKQVIIDDVQADAALLSLPTLLIYGEQDTATPPQYGMLLHEKIDGSTLELIPSVGHFLHLDAPDKVLHLMQDFLKHD